MMSAAGVGAVAAGLVIANRNRVSLKSFLVGSVAVSSALILIAASTEAPVVVAGFVLFGIGGSFVLASATTLFQRLAPADAEGTALGVYSLLVTGTTPLGSLLVGALAEAAGIRVTTALLGVGCLVTVAIGATIAYRHHQLGVDVNRGRVAW
jgi:MFS family permease